MILGNPELLVHRRFRPCRVRHRQKNTPVFSIYFKNIVGNIQCLTGTLKETAQFLFIFVSVRPLVELSTRAWSSSTIDVLSGAKLLPNNYRVAALLVTGRNGESFFKGRHFVGKYPLTLSKFMYIMVFAQLILKQNCSNRFVSS